MIIREADVNDAPAMKELHKRSVLGLCRPDYTLEQLEGWVGSISLERYQKRIEDHRSFIAEIDGAMVGYVRWNPTTNELCSIFIDPDYVRQGIAASLMKIACEDVTSYGKNELWLDASLTAVPFYESEGWEYVEQTMHGSLVCIRMTKRLDYEVTE